MGVAAARRESLTGIASALGAYSLWGVLPLYFHAIRAVPALEVLAHRAVWACLMLGALLVVTRHGDRLMAILRSRPALLWLTLATALIAVNWGTFIWAVAQERVRDVSLGYFINPLVTVLLAAVILRERLRWIQWAAVTLAALGVLIPILQAGIVPWVSLILAFAFGFYGLIHKHIALDGTSSLFIETALMTPVAALFLGMLAVQGSGSFGGDPAMTLLLPVSGLVTLLPLLLFIAGAKRIRYTTIGLLQYLAPSGHLLVAVAVLGEPLEPARLVAFFFIWTALAIYTADLVHQHRAGAAASAG